MLQHRLIFGVGLAGLALAAGCAGALPAPAAAHLAASIVPPQGALLSGAAAQWDVVLSDGTAPYSVHWDFGGGAVENTIALSGVTAPAASAAAQLQAGSWTVTVTVTDAAGQSASASASYTVAENLNPGGSGTTTLFTPQPGALYAVPLATSADVDEPVTIEIVTGVLPGPLAAASGIGVVVEGDASYVPNSFNAGAAGGATWDADGIWTGAVGNGDFLTYPDSFIGSTSLAGGLERYDFNVTPRGPGGAAFAGVSGVSGALCSFKLKFATPGTKTLRFEVYNGVDRTFYQAASGGFTPLYWGDVANDGSAGAPNAVVIGGEPTIPGAPEDPGSGLPAGFTPAADTLYAIPAVAAAGVDEAVTVAIVTGPTANAFKYMNSVGVTVEGDASYVLDSFNVGDFGGAMYDADGIWAGLAWTGVERFVPNPNVHDLAGDVLPISGGRVRFDLGVVPLCSDDISGRSGVLFNFKVKFAAPGTKTFGFEAFNGVKRTFYSDAGNAEYSWGDIANDGSAAPNSVVVN